MTITQKKPSLEELRRTPRTDNHNENNFRPFSLIFIINNKFRYSFIVCLCGKSNLPAYKLPMLTTNWNNCIKSDQCPMKIFDLVDRKIFYYKNHWMWNRNFLVGPNSDISKHREIGANSLALLSDSRSRIRTTLHAFHFIRTWVF